MNHERKKRVDIKRIEKVISLVMYILFLICIIAIFIILGKSGDKANLNSENEAYVELEVDDKVSDATKKNQDPIPKDVIAPKEPNGSKNSKWNLVLVNKWNKLPDNFTVKRRFIGGGHSIDVRAYPELQAMMDNARQAGLDPIICSSFRTMEKQRNLHENQIRKYRAQGLSYEDAKATAATWVAEPGTSEHESGLALDIVARSYQMLDKNQENTPEQKWLMDNSYKYGFILRYPPGKSEITGIEYEPWHYRYVGVEAAHDIYNKGVCLEEYLNE